MIFLKNLIRRIVDKWKFTFFIIEIGLLTLHYSISSSADFSALRFPLGVICYILIPGFVLTSNLTSLLSDHDVCWDLLFGFSIPVLIISIFWGFHIEPINFKLVTPILIAPFVFIMLVSSPKKFPTGFRKNYLTPSIFLILVLAIGVRLYYFSINTSSIAIDGGLYSDIARTIVSDGKFSSKILNVDPLNPYFNVNGFISYPLTVFSITTFFLIGGTSFVSAKLAVLFIGSLVVLLIYKIAHELFGKKTALMAGLISAFHPLLSYYSSIPYGPEILSTLFGLTSLYFFLRGIKNNEFNLRCMILSGLFASMTFGAWGLIPFFTLLTSLALISVLYFFKAGAKLCFYALSLFMILFFVYKFSTILLIELSLLAIPFMCLFVLWKKHTSLGSLKITVFIAAVALSLQLFFIHSYLAKEPYITGMEHMIVPLEETLRSDPMKSINPFFLAEGVRTDINYIINSFGRFWQSIAIILTPLLFGLFAATIINPVKLKEKIILLIFPVISSIFFVLTFSEYLFWYGNVFSDRLLILPVCFLLILSSVTINILLNASRPFRGSVLIAGREVKVSLKKFKVMKIFFALTFIVVIFSLIPLHISYTENFNVGYTNVLDWYGQTPLEWIENNTLPTDVFCASDANRLAWFTNRLFVGMTPRSGTLDASEMNYLIERFDVRYVVIDTFLMHYIPHSTLFDDLYKVPLNLGQARPIMEGDAINKIVTALISSKNSNYTQDFYGLRLVFEFSENSRVTRIYEVVSLSYSIDVKFMDDTFLQGWVPRIGDFYADGDVARVSTIKNEDWAYICMNNSQIIIDPSELPYLAVKLRGSGNLTTKFWISVIDVDATWHQIQSDTPAPDDFQVYVYDIGAKVEKKIKNVYLGVSGSNWPSVEYDWVIIYGWQVKG